VDAPRCSRCDCIHLPALSLCGRPYLASVDAPFGHDTMTGRKLDTDLHASEMLVICTMAIGGRESASTIIRNYVTFNHTPALCGLRGCKNRSTTFRGRMLYKATKPGLVLFHILACLIVLLFIRGLGPLLCIVTGRIAAKRQSAGIVFTQ